MTRNSLGIPGLVVSLTLLALFASTVTRAIANPTCRLPAGVNCYDREQWKQHPACACIDLRYADPRFAAAFKRWEETNGIWEDQTRGSSLPNKGIYSYPSERGQYSWTAKVTSRLNQKKICSGVLISSKALLTAGHCLAENIGVPGDIVHFQLGAEKTEDIDVPSLFTGPSLDGPPGVLQPQVTQPKPPRPSASKPDAFYDRSISRILHQQHSPDNSVPDFAVLLLNAKAPVTVRPIKVATKTDIDAALSARAVGYGLTERGTIGSKVFVPLLLVSKNCAGSFVHNFTKQPWDDWSAYGCLPGQEIIAAGFVDVGSPKVSSDTCVGDSGGPLVAPGSNPEQDEVLLAITSRAVKTRLFPPALTIVTSGQQVMCGGGGIYTAITGPVLETIAASLAKANETLGK